MKIKLKNINSHTKELTCTVPWEDLKDSFQDEFNKMIEIFEKVESPQLKMKALTSCGLTQDPKLVQKYLDYAFSGKVRSKRSIITSLST